MTPPNPVPNMLGMSLESDRQRLTMRWKFLRSKLEASAAKLGRIKYVDASVSRDAAFTGTQERDLLVYVFYRVLDQEDSGQQR